uniref:Integrase zinc-binding domain-containing protein n=1 Tax=Romanomermis culicivorax TaxID=13658 RepID=A0A915JI70_ROMCU
ADDKQLYRRLVFPDQEQWQLVVPLRHRNTILEYFHDSIFGCHMGMVKTLKKIQSYCPPQDKLPFGDDNNW